MADVSIVIEDAAHLLLQRRGRLAIVERRDDGRIYPIGDERSAGYPDTPQGMLDAVGREGWGDPETVRAEFEEITEKSEALARSSH